MSDDFRTYTRVDRFEKKRKNTKAISWLLFIGGLFVVALVSVLLFGPNDPKDPVQTVAGEEQSNAHTNSSYDKSSKIEESEDENANTSTVDGGVTGVPNDNNDVELETISSEDENVLEVVIGNWQPIGTEQEGPHTTTFEKETVDWKEMMEAIRVATGLTSDDIIPWWVERDGDQKVKATVSNRSETKIYRAYVTWVDGQGWMPTKVEKLKENDQKYRFEDENSSEG